MLYTLSHFPLGKGASVTASIVKSVLKRFSFISYIFDYAIIITAIFVHVLPTEIKKVSRQTIVFTVERRFKRSKCLCFTRLPNNI